MVIVENPSYPGALDTFRSYGAEIVGVPMDNGGMKMDALEEVLKQHKKVAFIYTIADFQNPTGRCMAIDRRKELVELAEKYDTFIVEDGPYSLISFDGQINPAIKSFDKYGRVIYSGSTSKTIAPGLRIGWLIADHESITKLVYLKMRDDLQVNNIAQRQVVWERRKRRPLFRRSRQKYRHIESAATRSFSQEIPMARTTSPRRRAKSCR